MKIKILILLATYFFFVSCGIEFDTDKSTNGVIEEVLYCPSTGIIPVPETVKKALTSNFVDNIQSMFTDIVKEVNKEDTWPADEVIVKDISLEQIKIPSTLDSSNTLGFISKMNIFISKKDGSNEIELGSVVNKNERAVKLIFKVSKKNIIDYVDKGFKLRINSVLRDCPSEDISYKNNMTVHIKL